MYPLFGLDIIVTYQLNLGSMEVNTLLLLLAQSRKMYICKRK